MSYEQRDNSGAMFKNDRQRSGTSDADFSGTVMVGGKLYWINGWKKEGKCGPFYSLSFKPKQDLPASAPAKAQAQAPSAAPPTAASEAPWENDVPF